MADIIVCPWCQSEIIQEEGQEPETFCPVCDNELSGYRTLQFDLGEEDDEEEEEPAISLIRGEVETDEDEDEDAGNRLRMGGALGLTASGDLGGSDQALLRYEESVGRLLDEQAIVPECPQCREYMLEAGQGQVTAEGWRANRPDSLNGAPVLEAPFQLRYYVCPSCYSVQTILDDADRVKVARRLAGEAPASGD